MNLSTTDSAVQMAFRWAKVRRMASSEPADVEVSREAVPTAWIYDSLPVMVPLFKEAR